MDIAQNIKRVPPFNNNVETGLRILCILNECFPKSFDVSKIVYLDYLTVHSADLDNSIQSLHTPVPYRNGEILIRKSIIENGLKLFIERGLIEIVYDSTGIQYKASEYSTPFLESLEEEYISILIQKAKWVNSNFSDLSLEKIKEVLNPKLEDVNNEFNIEILD